MVKDRNKFLGKKEDEVEYVSAKTTEVKAKATLNLKVIGMDNPHCLSTDYKIRRRSSGFKGAYPGTCR